MRGLTRLLSGLVLALYLGWVGLQTFHTHPPETGAAAADCQICKIAHQSPSLINPPVVPQFSFVLTRAAIAELSRPSLQIVFRSYGPAPPTV